MKKILIITYYWPPQGGVGVQRWLKFSKYLSKYNYEPVIYTQSKGVSPLVDNSLSKSIPSQVKVLRKSVFEPQKIFSFFTKKKITSDFLIKKKYSLFNRFLVWLRANFFIPDSRYFWIKPSIKFLSNYLRKNHIDLIISTGPPHSTHLIALILKKKHNIKWIADFRDPWTHIEYFDSLPLLNINRKKHKELEKDVVSLADVVLTVSPSWSKIFSQIGAKRTSVILNGFDLDDYNTFNSQITSSKSENFTIGYFGLYNESRDHLFFWETIKQIVNLEKDFHRGGNSKNLKLLFAGEVHHSFFTQVKSYGLEDNVSFLNYLPHKESIKKMFECDLLLVTQGDTVAVSGRVPAKVFEYLPVRKPILAIGKKDSDLEKILSSISCAWFVDFNNSELLYNTILDIYESNYICTDSINVFSREEQTKKLIQLISSIC